VNKNSTTQGHKVFRLLLALTVTTFFAVAATAANHIQLSAAGVTFGQTVRFHVVGLSPANPDAPPDPCHVQLALLDLDGKPITNARGLPAVEDGDVLPGQALTLLFNSEGVVRRGERLVVRGQVMLSSDAKFPPDPCSQMAPSLEITNNANARTQVFVSPGEIAGFNPQPDPPGFVRVAFDYPMIGLATGQEASLRLVAVPAPAPPTDSEIPPGPCHATLTFYDDAGQVLTNKRGVPFSKDVELEPGASAEFTVNSDNVKLSSGRVLVRAQVSSPTTAGFPPGPCLVFTSGLEIVNSDSAHSVHFVSPAEIHGFNPQPDPPGVPSAN